MTRGVLLVVILLDGCSARPLDNDPGLGPEPGLDAGMGLPRFDLSPPGSSDLGDTGTGLFQSAFTKLSLPVNFKPRSVAVADVTGDGRDDVIVGAEVSSSVSVYAASVFVFEQTAAGTLAAPVEYPAGSGSFESPAMLAVADFDGDGRLDVALTSYNDLRLLRQTSLGKLGAPRSLTPARIYDGSELLAAADLDGDGRDDIVGVGWNETNFNVWYQGDGFATQHDFACPHTGYNALAIADFDGDGSLDVAISSLEGATLCVALRPNGAFAAPTTTMLTENPPPQMLAATDVDGDGRPDLVMVSGSKPGSEYLGVAHQNQDGTFAPASTLAIHPYPSGLLLGDVDGDGLPDAVVSYADGLSVGVYRRLPQGGFAPEETYTYQTFDASDSGPQRTALGDLDGDGKPDIAGIATSLFVVYHR